MPPKRGTTKATKTTKGAQPAVGATLANLPELLRALLAPDNDVRDSAEATLKVLGKDPQIVVQLLNHVRTDADAQARVECHVTLHTLSSLYSLQYPSLSSPARELRTHTSRRRRLVVRASTNLRGAVKTHQLMTAGVVVHVTN
jgi:hypothetical protein